MFATSPAGGGHDRLFLLIFYFFISCFSVSLSIVFFVFVFSLFASFLSLFHRMGMSCLSYPVRWHGIALPTAVLTVYLVRGNVVSLWRSFVTTELVYLLLIIGLKNRRGHWSCWMSTGRTERTVEGEEHAHGCISCRKKELVCLRPATTSARLHPFSCCAQTWARLYLSHEALRGGSPHRFHRSSRLWQSTSSRVAQKASTAAAASAVLVKMSSICIARTAATEWVCTLLADGLTAWECASLIPCERHQQHQQQQQ